MTDDGEPLEPQISLMTQIPPEQTVSSVIRHPSSINSRWAWTVAVIAMVATLIPYLFGASLTGARPDLGVFSWYTFNVTDNCVYLSWMRQAADGHLFERNLFTTAAQGGHQLNLFFLTLGLIARLTHLPLIFIYHAARLVLGVALLRAVWWLIEMLVQGTRARKLGFLLICFSAGAGWMPGLWHADGIYGSVDIWQPEAVTFLSLYLFPLFVVSLLLMVGMLGWLLVAARTRSYKPALYAGICGFLLGNIHTYDVITVACIWTAYLIVRTIADRRFDITLWLQGVIAAVPTLITTGYTAWLLRTEQVFAKRAAVATLSPDLWWYATGFGLVLILAIVGIWAFRRSGIQEDDASRSSLIPHPSSRLFLITWSIVNVGVAYLPVAFQRKMLMGAHIPMAILAGVGAAWLLRNLHGRAYLLAGAGLIAVSSLTNVRFMLRDCASLPADPGPVRAYMYKGEVAALEWIREHAPLGAVIQPLPWVALNRSERRIGFTDNTVACFTPGLTGRAVDAGHWGETPDFESAMMKWARFSAAGAPDDDRRKLLRDSGVRYLVFSQKREETRPNVSADDLLLMQPNPAPYLRLVPEASNDDADVYEVVAP